MERINLSEEFHAIDWPIPWNGLIHKVHLTTSVRVDFLRSNSRQQILGGDPDRFGHLANNLRALEAR